MSTSPDPTDDSTITGVAPETPDDVRLAATGLGTEPVDANTDVDVATGSTGDTKSAAIDQTFEDRQRCGKQHPRRTPELTVARKRPPPVTPTPGSFADRVDGQGAL